MASTFTPNINLEEPARGDQVGVWDTPENANWTLTDLVVGGVATIGLNNANVVLAAAQFRARQITFNSTLTGSVAITFPTSFTKPYTIQNICTGSSAFVITLTTTAAGGQVICCPPGQAFECFNDGANIKFNNFGPPVGGYWDYAGSSNPAWNTGCTIAPYLNCDASTFSATTYPALAVILGSTTLPDSKGRVRATLNQGTGRLSAGVSGVDGNTLAAAGGNQSMQSHLHANTATAAFGSGGLPLTNAGSGDLLSGGAGMGIDATLAVTVTNALTGAGNSQNVQPTYVGGLTLIRAA